MFCQCRRAQEFAGTGQDSLPSVRAAGGSPRPSAAVTTPPRYDPSPRSPPPNTATRPRNQHDTRRAPRPPVSSGCAPACCSASSAWLAGITLLIHSINRCPRDDDAGEQQLRHHHQRDELYGLKFGAGEKALHNRPKARHPRPGVDDRDREHPHRRVKAKRPRERHNAGQRGLPPRRSSAVA